MVVKAGFQVFSCQVILAGKAVGCYSMINYVGDKPYIMIGQNKYVAYMNVVGLDCQLNHNSYIYSSSGKRIKNSGVLLKNGLVTVYGGKKKINGSKYWAIGVGLYVKASNVETPKGEVTSDPNTQNQTTEPQTS
ncbi:N-acetylmuramoyl-L-alanine amidase [Lactobacillus delbrueckii subsp. bulgaricus]|nr:N-acetylmuramoyl-L-alanine amidase [Lactobacillus delbrueckii subsp. bulgaricus]